mgnify:CR=1 FL=1
MPTVKPIQLPYDFKWCSGFFTPDNAPIECLEKNSCGQSLVPIDDLKVGQVFYVEYWKTRWRNKMYCMRLVQKRTTSRGKIFYDCVWLTENCEMMRMTGDEAFGAMFSPLKPKTLVYVKALKRVREENVFRPIKTPERVAKKLKTAPEEKTETFSEKKTGFPVAPKVESAHTGEQPREAPTKAPTKAPTEATPPKVLAEKASK